MPKHTNYPIAEYTKTDEKTQHLELINIIKISSFCLNRRSLSEGGIVVNRKGQQFILK